MADLKINKNWLVNSITIFTIVFTVFLIAKIKTELDGYNRTLPLPNISVSGEGSVFVKPDIVAVTVSIFKDNIDLLKAQKEETNASGKVVKFLKDTGIAESDIKTIFYNINPLYDYKNGSEKFRAYEVYQTFEVKIRDLNKVGNILSGVTSAGANKIGALRFTLDNPDTAKEKARNLAIKDAKNKAKSLSNNLGVHLSKIIAFYESGGGIVPFFGNEEKAFSMGVSSQVPIPAPAGENEIKVQVTISYEIK